MRHRNQGNEVDRYYWVFDDDEEARFREMLRKHKKVKCISAILQNIPITVHGSAFNLGKFEDDVF